LRHYFLALRGSSPWNRLVSASYGMLRVINYRELVPRYRVVREVAEKVVEQLRFGVQLDVLGPPRIGKSAGVTLGIVRRVVEYNIPNYTVIVATINRRVAVNLYRYLVGWWKKIYMELRKRPDINAMELARRVKIVLYLGEEHSCLRGLKEHDMEHCLSCPLLAENRRLWSKVPKVPFIDPWLAKASGYCLFQMLWSKSLVHNSIIVTTLNALPLILRAVQRAGVTKVILVIDEYLEALMRSRPVIKKANIARVRSRVGDRGVLRLVGEWNRLVTLLDQVLVKAHEEILAKKCGGNCPPGRLVEIYGLWKDNLRRNQRVKEIISKMRNVIEGLKARAKELPPAGRPYVLRLARRLERSLSLTTYLVRQEPGKCKVVEKLILHWSDKGLIGLPGAQLTALVGELIDKGISVAVVTTSIMSSSISDYKGIVLHPSLERIEYRVFRLKRVYGSYTFNKPVRMRSLGLMKLLDISGVSLILGYLLKREGSDVLVVSKTVLLKLLNSLPKERVRVYGDVERGVIDWVEVIKDNGVDRVYLVYPHGRIAMGVEPPVTSVRSINFVHGVRRPATEYVIVGRVPSLLLQEMLRQVESVKLTLESIPGAYVIAEREKGLVKLRLYTKWDYRYDIHCAAQILGRWFLLDVELVNIRRDYFPGFARSPFFYFEVGPVKGKLYRLGNNEEIEVKSLASLLGWPSEDPYIDIDRYLRNNTARLDTLLKRLRREETQGEQRKALRTIAKIIANARYYVEDYAAWIAAKTGLAVGRIASLLRQAAEYYPGLRLFTKQPRQNT